MSRSMAGWCYAEDTADDRYLCAGVLRAWLAAGPMTDGAALEVALRLKALANPARVKIMSFLFGSAAGEEKQRRSCWRARD